MEKKNKKLGELLLQYGLISSEELEKALKIQKEKNKRIGEILLDLNLVIQDQINWVLSKQLDIPYVQIEPEQLDKDLLKKFPSFLIKNYNLIPLQQVNDTLVIAMADPTDEEALQKIKSSYQKNFEVVLASFQNISELIQYISQTGDINGF
ncbi:MAG: hypothetical protein AB7E45_02605 [Candidatus Caldatribacteriota bacterium]